MATYRNRNDEETIYYPADFKLLISMDPIDGHTLGGEDGVNFQCTFIVGSKKVILDKEHMFQDPDDDDIFIAPLHSTDLGKGTISVLLEAQIPDTHFPPENIRNEAVLIPTKLKIV